MVDAVFEAIEAIGADVPVASSVRSVLGGAIITPAAPAAMDDSAKARMAAKPGADTPTTTGRAPARRMKRAARAADSEASSFGASPMTPSTVRPVAPTSA